MNGFTFHYCLLVPFSKFLENVKLSFIYISLIVYYYDKKEYKSILYTEKAIFEVFKFFKISSRDKRALNKIS